MANCNFNLLLTGGRAPATLALCRLFQREGHRVIVAETATPSLCRFSRAVDRHITVPAPSEDPQEYVKAIATIARDEAIDWVIPNCEGVFYLSKYRSLLPESCQLFADSIDTLGVLHHKWEFCRLLGELSIPAPRTWLFRNLDDLRQAIPRDLKIAIKPVYSRFSTKVQLLEAGDRTPKQALSFDCPWVAQEFLEGEHLCSYSVVHKGIVTAHATYPAKFCLGNMGTCLAFEAVDRPEVLKWVEDFAESIKFTGQIAFDFFVDKEGCVLPIECNPRAANGAQLFTAGSGLSHAFFGSEQATVLPEPQTLKQFMMPMLLFGWCSALRGKRVGSYVKTLLTARDALLDLRDPIPWLCQPILLAQCWRQGRDRGVGMLEASTADIEWNG